MAIWTDNFNDNNIDYSKWAKVEVGSAGVSETAQRIVTSVYAEDTYAGLVSAAAYDLSDGHIQIVSMTKEAAYQALQLGLEYHTNTSPWWTAADDWYSIHRTYGQNVIKVVRRIGGVLSERYSGLGGAGSVVLKIEWDGETIRFYRAGAEIYNEANALLGNDVYLYFWNAGTAARTGGDEFDNWEADYTPSLGATWTRKWGGSHHGLW